MLSCEGELLRVGAIVFVPEWKTCADAGDFQEETDLLEFGAPYDVAASITNDFRGPMCII